MDLKKLLGSTYREDMTLAEASEALLKVADEESTEIQKLKTLLSKSNSEAASYKKQLNEKLTKDELEKQKAEADMQALIEKYEMLEKESNVSKYKAEYLGLGYDDILATKTAEALVNGDLAKVFANQKKFNETQVSNVKKELLKATPQPLAGADAVMTKEQFDKMTYSELNKFSVENPSLYSKFTGGN